MWPPWASRRSARAPAVASVAARDQGSWASLRSGFGADGQVITFRTNVGDVVTAGPGHPLRFVDEDATGGLKPYVLVRGRLEALVARPVMYELVEHGEKIDIDGKAMFAVRSGGEIYPIMPAEKLERPSA